MDPNELARYRSHKVVRAGRILSITVDNAGMAADLKVETVAAGGKYFARATTSMCVRFQEGGRELEVGDFYVVYDDGYESLSPKEAFENGYGRLEE